MTSRRQFLLQSAAFGTNPNAVVTSVLLAGVEDFRMLRAEGTEVARQFVLPPGSTLKPFVLLALFESGKLRAGEEYACPGRLEIDGRQLNCSHPRLSVPMNLSRAIAYSCNCAVEHWSQRFEPNELSKALSRRGFGIQGVTRRTQPLAALGEEGVRVSPVELLRAYRGLAVHADEPGYSPVVSGLEGAVQFGTGQKAQLASVQVAGKTGTIATQNGNHFAWFAGFAPSRRPRVVVTALVPGRSGGSDAAPEARRVLADYFGVRKS